MQFYFKLTVLWSQSFSVEPERLATFAQIWPNSRAMNPINALKAFEDALENKKKKGLLRSLDIVERKKRAIISIDGRELVNFSSNDYLGLSSHEALAIAAKDALDEWGTGTGASRLMGGDSSIFHELEDKLATISGKESSLFFGCGYLANIGVISGLLGRRDCIFADKLVHASILDGIRLSRAKLFRFNHNNTSHLEDLLKRERHKHKQALIIVESLYSMDGDCAPLPEIIELKEKFDALLMVDEAHAVGVLGRKGRGLVGSSMAKGVEIIVGTFGKAYGSYGAYAAVDRVIKNVLINQARTFVFSTGLPPHVVAANIKAVELAYEMDSVRQKVAEISSLFRKKMKKRGLKCLGDHHIVPIVVGNNQKTVELQNRLIEAGFYTKAIRPPTVPEGTARLRISVTANHSFEQIDALAHALGAIF